MNRTRGLLWTCCFAATLGSIAVSSARGQLELSFADQSTHRGLFSTEVRVSGEQPVSSINVSIG